MKLYLSQKINLFDSFLSKNTISAIAVQIRSISYEPLYDIQNLYNSSICIFI